MRFLPRMFFGLVVSACTTATPADGEVTFLTRHEAETGSLRWFEVVPATGQAALEVAADDQERTVYLELGQGSVELRQGPAPALEFLRIELGEFMLTSSYLRTGFRLTGLEANLETPVTLQSDGHGGFTFAGAEIEIAWNAAVERHEVPLTPIVLSMDGRIDFDGGELIATATATRDSSFWTFSNLFELSHLRATFRARPDGETTFLPSCR